LGTSEKLRNHQAPNFSEVPNFREVEESSGTKLLGSSQLPRS
jgi:hypothetical protein